MISIKKASLGYKKRRIFLISLVSILNENFINIKNILLFCYTINNLYSFILKFFS